MQMDGFTNHKTLIQVGLIHSFIFSNCFMQVKATVDLEPVLGTLGLRQEYTYSGCDASQSVSQSQGCFNYILLIFIAFTENRNPHWGSPAKAEEGEVEAKHRGHNMPHKRTCLAGVKVEPETEGREERTQLTRHEIHLKQRRFLYIITSPT